MSMSIALQRLVVVFIIACPYICHAGSSNCLSPDTIDYSLRQAYCDQPIFANFVPNNEEFQLVDNICFTYFPLPDDPNTFTYYQSTVYCDGSFNIQTAIGTDFGIGVSVVADPYSTVRTYIVGYAGCDTYILYRCREFGGPSTFNSGDTLVTGISPNCNPIGLSCLRKVQEVLDDRCIPEQDFYILPMKLPNRCVTQQLCVEPPNPFYNKLPTVSLL